MKDELGDRMKDQYEDRTRMFLPRRTYTIIRVDGKAFHTLTRGYKKPFDAQLMRMMDNTAIAMCKEIQGVCFAYVQSDEISLLLTDFAKITTDAWFDGNVQKMASIAAACATAHFNRELYVNTKSVPLSPSGYPSAMFDARVFTIPDQIEVENYFIWRQNDATRNSIQMAARSVYSHKECENKNTSELQEMLHKKGINWNDYTSGEKRGRCIVKQQYAITDTETDGKVTHTIRNRWVSYDGTGCDDRYEIPIFTQNRMFLRDMIPERERFAPTTQPMNNLTDIA